MRFTFAKLDAVDCLTQGKQGWVAPRTAMALTVALLIALLGSAGRDVAAQASPHSGSPSRSTTIALTSDEQRLVVVNREANSCLNYQSER